MLKLLLGNPTIISNEKSLHDFDSVDGLHLWTPGQIYRTREALNDHASFISPFWTSVTEGSDTAVLMLTSGSTGNAKAVRLTYNQILASVKGKSEMHNMSSTDVFLNWTGLDHVANLVEIHVHAMSLCASQIHLPGAEVLLDPMKFLETIHQHRVSYTFAPNFFLGMLISRLPKPTQHQLINRPALVSIAKNELPLAKTLQKLALASQPDTDKNALSARFDPTQQQSQCLELSCLKALISGGEANVVQTCADLTNALQQYNTPKSFIRPGYGMTETCAGSVYNAIDCPVYDIEQSSEFASLGQPIPGIQMRIVRSDGSSAHPGESGELQISGAVLFPGYYNNPEETAKSYTADGWFKTGDKGIIDANGRLSLTGREKDLIIVNGLNLQPQRIECAIQEAQISGVTPTCTVAFGQRPTGLHTEVIVVVYLPTYDLEDRSVEDRQQQLYQRQSSPTAAFSTLGKLSRPKIRKAYEEGHYDKLVRIDQEYLKTYHEELFVPPTTDTEIAVVRKCQEVFGSSAVRIGVNDNLFMLGASSIDLLTFKMGLQDCLGLSSIPITYFFSYPILQDLAHSLVGLMPKTTSPITQPSSALTYDPVVILDPNTGSTKTPLWFIHPGMGEILIFMNLSRYITDHPVYALRARGFDPSNGGYYSSMSEIIQSYLSGIKRIQPHGPYAFLGYSFGSILSFEITKILESSKEEVKFLGTLDQPPRFKQRARTYDWYECAMTVAFFLGLIGEGYAYESLPDMRKLTKEQVLDHVFERAPEGRCEELGMTRQKLGNWAELAWKLKVIARDYDPRGIVKRMDVFYTGPLIGLVKAKTTQEWRRDFIGQWDEFVGDVQYHEVKGTHRTLISPPYLVGFWKVFKRAMENRGL
ncbi:related to long-chain-fatty-acid CoA ligase FAA2 [Rhynchosporium graminicola]|uniref:Related to long-chain-fatty-acid CoA ligase FAA2 n=1 Tax=Rhynchosporium graminicola TaxID=2792576 RepID=A0A1E1L4J4_9HELO|nr:related to long-chain-fatty-acid CoA ligase FAA2 [Rhynchosporium commune]